MGRVRVLLVAAVVCTVTSALPRPAAAAPAVVVPGVTSPVQRVNLEAARAITELVVAPPAPRRHGRLASAAALRLIASTGAVATPEQVRALRALDRSSLAVRGSLAGLLDAFARYRLIAGRTSHGRADDGAALLSAKVELVSHASTLRAALAVAAVDQCTPATIWPVLTISLGTCDDTYELDVALSVDAGGHDHYRNNAGGGQRLAAAAFDFGGDDRYEGRNDWFSQGGENGGGYLGSGALVDFAGRDTYRGKGFGLNGGGGLGSGFLVDVSGDDRYIATKSGSRAGPGAANGGGAVGSGFLLDLGGNDVYDAGRDDQSGSVNGGAMGALLAWAMTAPASGFLLDTLGDDRYIGGHFASNGAGVALGDGLLVDARGDDAYIATRPPSAASTIPDLVASSNGGGALGSGALVDLAGRDLYDDGVRPAAWDQTVVPKGTGKQVDAPG